MFCDVPFSNAAVLNGNRSDFVSPEPLYHGIGFAFAFWCKPSGNIVHRKNTHWLAGYEDKFVLLVNHSVHRHPRKPRFHLLRLDGHVRDGLRLPPCMRLRLRRIAVELLLLLLLLPASEPTRCTERDRLHKATPFIREQHCSQETKEAIPYATLLLLSMSLLSTSSKRQVCAMQMHSLDDQRLQSTNLDIYFMVGTHAESNSGLQGVTAMPGNSGCKLTAPRCCCHCFPGICATCISALLMSWAVDCKFCAVCCQRSPARLQTSCSGLPAWFSAMTLGDNLPATHCVPRKPGGAAQNV